MAEAFPTSGSIDPKTFPFLLMDLHRQGATGSLKVDGPSYQKALYYRGGRILFGSSNDPRDQLGAILIEGGKISPEQLEDVNTKVGPGNPLAKVLSESGFVNQRELSEAARAKVERILGDVIAYGSGTFDFEDGVLPKGAVDLKLSTERLILAAVRRIADRGFVLRHLENLDVVLAPTQDSASRLPEIQGEDGGLADQLDGRKSLRTAASQTRLDEFEAAKVACALLFLGLAERSTGASPADEAPLFVAPEEPELDLVQTARMAFNDPAPATVIMPASADATVSAPPIEPSRDPAFYVPAPAPAPPPTTGFAMVTPGAPPPPEEEQPTRPVPVREASSSRLPLVPPPMRTPEPPAPPPAPSQSTSRPSKEDLAALDALLNSRAIEGPLAPLEKPTHSPPAWEPRFGSAAPKARAAGGGRAVVLGAFAAVLAVGAAAAWYFFLGPGAGGARIAQARPTPAPTTTRPTPSPVTSPSPATSPTESVESPGTASVPPPSEAPSVAPSLRPSPVATAVPTPLPTPSPRPTPTPKTDGGAMALADARGLLERGDLVQAARGFAANVKAAPGRAFSVQILVACSDETVQKAVQNVPDPEMYILPVNFKGRSCYRVCWGIYDSEAKAESATRSVPDYFRKGGASPKVVPTSNLLP